jgi:DNA-directed RNA polymerase subunit M/transcription elongation factor TFIIS
MTSSFVPFFVAAEAKDVKQQKVSIVNVISASTFLNKIVDEKQSAPLLALKFQEQPLFNIEHKDVLFELLGYLREADNKKEEETLQDRVNFLLSNPFVKCTTWKDIIFQLPNLKGSKQRVDLDLDMITYQARGVKGSGKCGKCGSTEVIYTIKQTRAGDEAASTFAQCASATCGNKWRVS